MTSTAPGRADSAAGNGDAPSSGGRRRRSSREPAAFGRLRPPRRRRPGLSLIGIPLGLVVELELLALCVLLVLAKRPLVSAIAIAIGVLIVVLGLLRVHSIRVGTWLWLRIGYLFRHRETLVAAAEYAGERRDEVDRVDVPPELHAFFPGMTLWEARTHDGDRLGIVQWFGTCAATLRVAPAGGIVRHRNTTDNMPIESILAALEGQGLALDSVQVLTQTIVGELDAQLTPLLGAANAELGGAAARVRNRAAFVTVRLDPSSAAAAITARGGGNVGIARVLSAALSRIQAAAGQADLQAEVLDADEAGRVIAESFYHQATPYDPIIRWTESITSISSTRMAHRSFALTDIRRPVLSEVPVGNVFAYALATQAKPLDDGGWSTRTVVRLTCRSGPSLTRAARELRSNARRVGITLQPLDAAQYLGVRATVPIGGV
ncbi:MAG TPA: type VII secretion protein EccE [Jatrophihabitantaceae bacterium]|jgi:type VII secretion protein EccE